MIVALRKVVTLTFEEVFDYRADAKVLFDVRRLIAAALVPCNPLLEEIEVEPVAAPQRAFQEDDDEDSDQEAEPEAPFHAVKTWPRFVSPVGNFLGRSDHATPDTAALLGVRGARPIRCRKRWCRVSTRQDSTSSPGAEGARFDVSGDYPTPSRDITGALSNGCGNTVRRVGCRVL
jgi:hypothetical protein